MALANGVEFLGDNAIKVSEKKIPTKWERFKTNLSETFDRFTPFKSDMK